VGLPSLTPRGDVSNSLLDGFFPFFSFSLCDRWVPQSLAGDELDEQKDSQLPHCGKILSEDLWKEKPPLRRDTIK
jgi:hypothetical protein